MSSELQAMIHGIRGLELGYAIVWVAFIAGLIRGRAPMEKYVVSPLTAGAMTLLAGFVNGIAGSVVPLFGISPDSTIGLLFGVTQTVAVGFFGGLVWARWRAPESSEYRRGAMVNWAQGLFARSDGRVSRRSLGTKSAGITLANVPVPLEDETKHFKIIGTTGTGKSTAIREILTGALARGDRVVIADPDGGYARRFYDPARGDVILSPFLSDGRKWDLLGEIVNHYDIDQLARSLIPDSGDPDRVWSDYGRTFFSAVVRQALKLPNPNDRELLRLLTASPQDSLRVLLAGTAAAPFLEEGNEKMFGSIRSVVGAALKPLEYIIDQESAPFSVRQWVREGRSQQTGGRGGVLFIPYTAGEIASLRAVISAWMRLGIFEAMDAEEGDQHLWFIIDELDALGEVDGLKDALARLRKFGGRCVLGLQSISQVSGTYGRGTAETIVENCGNTYILRCSTSEHGGTSEFASKLIGQREVVHRTTSRTSGGVFTGRSSTTTGEQIRTEAAVMASEIERLPDLVGFLKLASIPDWQVATLTCPSESDTTSHWRPERAPCSPARAAAPLAPEASVQLAESTPPSAPPDGSVALRRRGGPRKATVGARTTPKRTRGSKAGAEPAPPTGPNSAEGA